MNIGLTLEELKFATVTDISTVGETTTRNVAMLMASLGMGNEGMASQVLGVQDVSSIAAPLSTGAITSNGAFIG